MRLRVVPMVLGVLAAALAAGAALVGLTVWLGSVALTHPRGYAQPDPKSFTFSQTPLKAHGLAFENIAFTAPNGAMIRGWLAPAADDGKALAIVVLHGRGADRRFALPHLPMLRDIGAAVALIDLRENGLSDGASRGTALAMREAEDAVAGAAEMRRRGYRKVVLFGCSLGGAAAILAAARDPAIDGVIAESPVSDFRTLEADVAANRLARLGLRAPWAAEAWGRAVVAVTRARVGLPDLTAPIDVIAAIPPRPILLIQGEDDRLTRPERTQAMAARAGASATFALLPRAAHCDGFDLAPEAYRARVAILLEAVRHSRRPPSAPVDEPRPDDT